MRFSLPRTTLLIRHGESSKNLSFSYSSTEGDEPLTQSGDLQAKYLADRCKEVVDNNKRKRIAIFASIADRTVNTALPLANSLSVPVTTLSELAPLHDPNIAGKSIEAVHTEFPNLGREVNLYRMGMMSGYDVSWPGEGIRSLEARVKNMMREQLTSEYDLAIVVGHKSTLTCLIINFLRAYGIYPLDFYGYINLEPGAGIRMDCLPSSMKVDLLFETHVYPRRKAAR
jgi:broad specificity phosphatase PhoE